MSLLHSLDIENSGGLSGKGLGFSVELCWMSHKLKRQGTHCSSIQGYFTHSVLWLIRGKGSTEPFLLFVVNREALLAIPVYLGAL